MTELHLLLFCAFLLGFMVAVMLVGYKYVEVEKKKHGGVRTIFYLTPRK